MPEDLYESPREAISQGDFLALMPNAYLAHPLRPLYFREDGSCSEQPPVNPVNDPRLPVVAACRQEKAILLTYDCEIDKAGVKQWIVCPVISLSEIPGKYHTEIKKNKLFSMLYLPAYRDILTESVIVLNHMTTLEKNFVQSAVRLVSLSDIGRSALYAQFIRWLTRWQLRDIRCPNCSVIFDATEGMTVRAD